MDGPAAAAGAWLNQGAIMFDELNSQEAWLNVIDVLVHAQEREKQLIGLALALAECAASPERMSAEELAEDVALLEDCARANMELNERIAEIRLHAADPANFQLKH
jgi:hypothetical protein